MLLELILIQLLDVRYEQLTSYCFFFVFFIYFLNELLVSLKG